MKKRLLAFLLSVAMIVGVMPTALAANKREVRLNKTTATVYVGQSIQLKVSGSDKKALWSTSDKAIATVTNKGKVTAKKAGETEISAKVSSKTLKCSVTVKSVALSDKQVKATAGETKSIKLNGAKVKSVKIGNKNIASVIKKGNHTVKISAKSAGNTTAVIIGTNGKKYSCKITVVEKTHTVTFNSNEGTSVASQTIADGRKATAPESPTKKGYTFVGWYIDSNFEKQYDFNSDVVSDLTLYAKWSKNVYKVSFESNGGTAISEQQIEENGTVVNPASPEKSGYTFDGWYTDNTLQTKYDFSAPVTKNITLYAKWNVIYIPSGSSGSSGSTDSSGSTTPVTPAEKYTVTFNSNGGSNVDSQNVAKNETAAEPNVPTKAGFTFDGWYTDETYTNKYVFTTPVTNKVELYAKWMPVCNIPITGGEADWQYVAKSSDDFEGSTLDDSKWNKELWYPVTTALAFKEDNVSVKDGNLILTAKKESYKDKAYTCGAVESKFDVPGSTDGPSYVEVRAKVLPKEANVLSAIWLQSSPTDSPHDPNPEIDIIETTTAGQYKQINSALHVWPDGEERTHRALGGINADTGVDDISKDYHTYGMLREGNQLTMFFDGKQMWTRDCTSDYPSLATMARHVVLSLEGHNGQPNDNNLPNDFLIDYVHTFVSYDYTAPKSVKPTGDIPIQNGTAKWQYIEDSSDDFSEDTLSDNKWTKKLWYDTSGQLAFKEDKVSSKDGKLILKVEKEQEPYNGKNYTCGSVESKFNVPGSTDGPSYVEVRAKALSITGVSSSIWLQSSPTDSTNNPNPEINIMSHSLPSSALALWPDGNGPEKISSPSWNTGVTYINNDYLSKDYHTYGLLRDENQLTMFFDGKQMWTKDCSDNPELATMARHIVLSLNGDSQPSDTDLSTYFLIDYVHTFVSQN